MRPQRPNILDPRSGRVYRWGVEKKPFVDSIYSIGTERMHRIVCDLLLRKSYRKRSSIASSNPTMLKLLFKKYDVDNSGSLDSVEFYNMLLDLGLQCISYNDYTKLFKLYDKDNDGSITYNEWCKVHCEHFSDDITILDLPSTRLDIKHSSMAPSEALKALSKEILYTIKIKNINLSNLFINHYDYRGYVKYMIAKSIFRNNLCVGIGNEPALNLLLDKSICYNKHNISYVSIKKINELIYENSTSDIKKITDSINLDKDTSLKVNNYMNPIPPLINKKNNFKRKI